MEIEASVMGAVIGGDWTLTIKRLQSLESKGKSSQDNLNIIFGPYVRRLSKKALHVSDKGRNLVQ